MPFGRIGQIQPRGIQLQCQDRANHIDWKSGYRSNKLNARVGIESNQLNARVGIESNQGVSDCGTDLRKNYIPFADDFEPVNLGIVHRFCVALSEYQLRASLLLRRYLSR